MGSLVKKSDRKYVRIHLLYTVSLLMIINTLKSNLSNMDTNDFFSEVTSLEYMQGWYLGREKVSCLAKFGVS